MEGGREGCTTPARYRHDEQRVPTAIIRVPAIASLGSTPGSLHRVMPESFNVGRDRRAGDEAMREEYALLVRHEEWGELSSPSPLLF